MFVFSWKKSTEIGYEYQWHHETIFFAQALFAIFWKWNISFEKTKNKIRMRHLYDISKMGWIKLKFDLSKRNFSNEVDGSMFLKWISHAQVSFVFANWRDRFIVYLFVSSLAYTGPVNRF